MDLGRESLMFESVTSSNSVELQRSLLSQSRTRETGNVGIRSLKLCLSKWWEL